MKTIWTLWTKNPMTSIPGILLLVSGICLWAYDLITMDTLVGFSVLPFSLLFSKDKWFKKNKDNATNK